jgi:uncharacterized membrane protein
MTRLPVAYAATLLVILVLDAIWLLGIARPWYRAGIGHLMAAQPNLAAAAAFYLMFAVGVLVFAVLPQQAVPGWRAALWAGALFGLFTYATYDLTNLATLRDWPLGLSLLDIAWGCCVGAASAAAGKLALDAVARPGAGG